MNKFTNKIAGKFKIFLPVALLILVAGIVLAAIFGMNTAPEYGSEKTLKIHVNSYYSEERVNAVETACAKVFSDERFFFGAAYGALGAFYSACGDCGRRVAGCRICVYRYQA